MIVGEILVFMSLVPHHKFCLQKWFIRDDKWFVLQICGFVKSGWSVVQDSKGSMGPYAYNYDQWVSYDDVASIRAKVRIVLYYCE